MAIFLNLFIFDHLKCKFQKFDKGASIPKALIWVLAAPVCSAWHFLCWWQNTPYLRPWQTRVTEIRATAKIFCKIQWFFRKTLCRLLNTFWKRHTQNRSHQIVGHPILYMVLKPPCNSMNSLGHWDSWRLYQIYNKTLQWTWCKNFLGQIGHLQLIRFIPTNEAVKNVNM